MHKLREKGEINVGGECLWVKEVIKDRKSSDHPALQDQVGQVAGQWMDISYCNDCKCPAGGV